MQHTYSIVYTRVLKAADMEQLLQRSKRCVTSMFLTQPHLIMKTQLGSHV